MLNTCLKFIDPRRTSAKIIALVMLTVFAFTTKTEAETVSFTTYYPPPQGSYDRIKLLPQASLPTPCAIGSLAVEAGTNKLVYCRNNGSGLGVWGPLSGIWDQTGDNIYPAATTTNSNIILGIGTTTPEFKLTLDNDGGILAMGEFGSGTFENMDPDWQWWGVKRFKWSPAKAALRVGTFNYGASDDSMSGDYSVSFANDSFAVGIGSSIGAGNEHGLWGDYGTITGGNYSFIGSDAHHATITAYYGAAEAPYSTVLGMWNQSNSAAIYSVMGGSWCNYILGEGQVIMGYRHGDSFNSCSWIPGPFDWSQDQVYSAILGGFNAHPYGDYSTIAGGRNPETHDDYAFNGGGQYNYSFGTHAFLGGGYNNYTGGNYSVTGGGNVNNASGAWSVVGGGTGNSANGNHSVIPGGNANGTGTASIAAGYNNSSSGTGYHITLGYQNQAQGQYSWVMGRQMRATNTVNRNFIWGYHTTTQSSFSSNNFIIYTGKMGIRETAPSGLLSITGNGSEDFLAITSTTAAFPGNIFMVKANGFVGIGNNNPQYPLQVGNLLDGGSGLPVGYLNTAGAFIDPSSRTFKDNIKPLNTDEAIDTVLRLDPVTYNYKVNKKEHHVGFIAEDVPDLVASKSRDTVDTMNVTAALTAVVKDQQKQIKEQEELLQDLKQALQRIKTDRKSH